MFKEIIQPFNYTFSVSQKGLCAISVSASCKYGKLLGLRGGEDLRVEIDDLKLREVPAKDKPQHKDIPSAWNGTELKGLSKTVVFILWLEQGEHTIKFIPDRGAIIEKEPEIILLDENKKEIELLTDLQAQDGNCRPWITIALIDLPLKSFSCEATVKWRKFDGDDIKIIIDNKIKKNNFSILHRNWIFSANIFKKLFQKERQLKTFQKNLKKGIHYIELWADQMPILHKASLEIGEIEFPEPKLLKAKIIWQEANLREETNTYSKILVDLKKDEIVEILEKAIQGERPKNQKGEYLFSDRWHKAQYKKQIGYIYSEALEIEEEDKETIKNFIIQKSKELKEDKNLMLAITERESQFFPYTVGQLGQGQNYQRAGKGVMQINDITAEWIRKSEKINYDLQDIFEIKQNIEGGIKYFKYLKTFYKENDLEYLEKLLISWNCGLGCIENKNKPIDYSTFEDPTGIKKFIIDVKNFYQKDKDQNGFSKIFLITIIGILFISIALCSFSFLSKREKFKEKIYNLGKVVYINTNSKGEEFYKLVDDLDNNGKLEKMDFKFYYDQKFYHTEIKFDDQKVILEAGAPSGYTKDIDKDGVKEVIIELSIGVNNTFTQIFKLKNNKLQLISGGKISIPEGGFLSDGSIEIIDYDNDGDLEIKVDYYTQVDPCKTESTIYEYINNKFIKSKEVKIDEEKCRKAIKNSKG